LTDESVGSYVLAYEEAYKRNLGLTDLTTTFSVTGSVESVRTVDDGYVVALELVQYFNEQGLSVGNETATVIHADGPRYTAVYFVTDDRLLRDEVERGETPAPRRGTVVECWEPAS
jgi:hypothetical protein